MKPIAAIRRNREAVLERWFQSVLDSYPPDTARFMRSQKDRFRNPVGHTLREGLAALVDGLAEGRAPSELARPVDDIVRIRAVQEFAPSAAVRFVFELGGILRETAGLDEAPAEERAAAAGALEALALLAFDTYMACREKLFEIRVREIRESQLFAARAVSGGRDTTGGLASTAREGR